VANAHRLELLQALLCDERQKNKGSEFVRAMNEGMHDISQPPGQTTVSRHACPRHACPRTTPPPYLENLPKEKLGLVHGQNAVPLRGAIVQYGPVGMPRCQDGTEQSIILPHVFASPEMIHGRGTAFFGNPLQRGQFRLQGIRTRRPRASVPIRRAPQVLFRFHIDCDHFVTTTGIGRNGQGAWCWWRHRRRRRDTPEAVRSRGRPLQTKAYPHGSPVGRGGRLALQQIGPRAVRGMCDEENVARDGRTADQRGRRGGVFGEEVGTRMNTAVVRLRRCILRRRLDQPVDAAGGTKDGIRKVRRRHGGGHGASLPKGRRAARGIHRHYYLVLLVLVLLLVSSSASPPLFRHPRRFVLPLSLAATRYLVGGGWTRRRRRCDWKTS
jgi:hypothetical protein